MLRKQAMKMLLLVWMAISSATTVLLYYETAMISHFMFDLFYRLASYDSTMHENNSITSHFKFDWPFINLFSRLTQWLKDLWIILQWKMWPVFSQVAISCHFHDSSISHRVTFIAKWHLHDIIFMQRYPVSISSGDKNLG